MKIYENLDLWKSSFIWIFKFDISLLDLEKPSLNADLRLNQIFSNICTDIDMRSSAIQILSKESSHLWIPHLLLNMLEKLIKQIPSGKHDRKIKSGLWFFFFFNVGMCDLWNYNFWILRKYEDLVDLRGGTWFWTKWACGCPYGKDLLGLCSDLLDPHILDHV